MFEQVHDHAITVTAASGPDRTVVRYLCCDSCCSHYRNAGDRSSNTPDPAMGEAGFRRSVDEP
jgi:hypothetical protein